MDIGNFIEASKKLKTLGVSMQQALDNMKKFNSQFNRFGAIFNYHLKQEEAVSTSISMISIIDPYWEDKYDELFDMARERDLKTTFTFVQCLEQIQREILDAMTLEVENKRGIEEWEIFLLEEEYRRIKEGVLFMRNNDDTMFKCIHCGSLIHPADIVKDETLNGPIDRCPICDSDVIEEVILCTQCTNYDIPDEMDAEGLCKDCVGEKRVEVEFEITVSIAYKAKVPYKDIRDYVDDGNNPLSTKEIHQEVRNQVAEGNYCITNYTWEEV